MDLQLKRIRKMRGVKQGEIARELGVKTSRYGTWERGERNMSFPQACAIADILDCTLDEIAGREQSANTPTLARSSSTAATNRSTRTARQTWRTWSSR